MRHRNLLKNQLRKQTNGHHIRKKEFKAKKVLPNSSTRGLFATTLATSMERSIGF